MTLLHPPLAAPSTWITRWAHLIRRGGRVLDLACGSGRHAAWLAGQGHAVLAVDRDATAVAALPAGPNAGGTWGVVAGHPAGQVLVQPPGQISGQISGQTSGQTPGQTPGHITGRVADLEKGNWPLGDEAPFDAIVVTNYLHRPLWPHLLAALAPGGVLLYETFAFGNETVGKPSRPDFLLRPGELLDVVRGQLRVAGYEDGVTEVPKTAFIQRICAVREVAGDVGGTAPPRYPLPR